LSSNIINFGDSKDTYAIISLQKYLGDAVDLSKIEHSTITSLKKILTNIDVNIFYKNSSNKDFTFFD
jgi:hypothetical protein